MLMGLLPFSLTNNNNWHNNNIKQLLVNMGKYPQVPHDHPDTRLLQVILKFAYLPIAEAYLFDFTWISTYSLFYGGNGRTHQNGFVLLIISQTVDCLYPRTHQVGGTVYIA